jgi:hypothetical protein
MLTVVADGLDRALFQGILAGLNLIITFGLFADVGVTFVFVPLEIVRRRLAAQITIDAVGIHEPRAVDVVFHFICIVSHGIPPGNDWGKGLAR